MRILIIDKMNIFLEVVVDFLKENGFCIYVVSNLENIRSYLVPNKFDLILISTKFHNYSKGINIYKIAEKITKKLPYQKVAFLTDKVTYYDKFKSKELNTYGVIDGGNLDKLGLINALNEIITFNEKQNNNVPKLFSSNYEALILMYKYGNTRQEIANKMFFSIETIGVYISNIYKKLNVKNYQEFILKVDEQGFK